MDGVAVDVELFGGRLGRAVVVEPGLEGFEDDGTLFVGEGSEPSEGCSSEVVHHVRGADCRGGEEIPIENSDAAVDERAGKGYAGEG